MRTKNGRVVVCGCCGEHRRHEARNICHRCYKRHEEAGTLDVHSKLPPRQRRAGGYQAQMIDCLRCGRLQRHYARKLCGLCITACERDGTLADWPRATRPNAEVLADFDVLRGRGYGKFEIARRMGMTVDALDRAVRKTRGTAAMDRQPPALAAYLDGMFGDGADAPPPEPPEPGEDEQAFMDELLSELDETERYRFRRWAAKAANGLQFRPDECDALAPGATIDGTPYLDAPVRDAVRSL